MNSSLGWAPVETSSNKDDLTAKSERKVNRSRTLRRKRPREDSKVTKFLNSIQAKMEKEKARSEVPVGAEEDEDGSLADFTPHRGQGDPPSEKSATEQSEGDESITRENFAQLGNVTSEDYYKQYVPYYTQMSGQAENLHASSGDDLMKKLNYMIHLLEEQHDEKTNNVTEELVLYLFLGVFVIFIVDSFARAGKYTR